MGTGDSLSGRNGPAEWSQGGHGDTDGSPGRSMKAETGMGKQISPQTMGHAAIGETSVPKAA